jgi:hypothetical protein
METECFYVLQSCNILHHVVWYIDTNISEEPAASILSPEDGGSKFLQNVILIIETKIASLIFLFPLYSGVSFYIPWKCHVSCCSPLMFAFAVLLCIRLIFEKTGDDILSYRLSKLEAKYSWSFSRRRYCVLPQQYSNKMKFPSVKINMRV